ncbi:MAG: ATP-dependent metallopeptidase FtsH/Yme1/Tma family protein, partial [Actinomycetota bacterium]|nr:ATP-dependent metallopeptidase FtsH/Yme1/Tma family protein [Actinomycetota bacterium]
MDNLPPPPPPPPRGRSEGRSNPPRNNQSRGENRRNSGQLSSDRQNGQENQSQWRRWLPWVAIGLFLAAVILPGMLNGPTGPAISYSEFIDEVRNGSVQSIEINNVTGEISGTLSDGSSFTSTGGGERGLSDTDEELIRSTGVDYEFVTPSSNWLLNLAGLLLPVMLIIGFFMW